VVLQFPVLSCPKGIRVVADDFKDILGPHYRAFVACLCGAMFGIACFSVIARCFAFSPSVSSICRLYDARRLVDKLNNRHRKRILRLLGDVQKDPSRYLWAIDDTLIAHSGRKIWGAYYWHDHNSKGTVFGHKLLVLGLVDRKRRVLIPVFWEILHRVGTKDHEKGWKVAKRLLKHAAAFGFPKFTVVADSWFAGEEFFDALVGEKLGFDFVIEIKSNRKVVGHAKKRNLDIGVDEFFKSSKRTKIFYWGKKKWAAEAVLWFKDSKRQLKVAAVANKKRLDEKPFAFYVSNRLTWNASQLWAVARDRWTIEVQFRDLKQIFALGEAAVRSQKAVETSISVSAIALTAIRFEQLSQADANEDQNIRPRPAGSIVRDYQLQSLTRGISELANQRDTPAKLKLFSRFHRENFGKKPTETRVRPKTRSGYGVTRKAA
jgi:Transposase DDE domain